jgi:hypothetical protein
MIPSASTSISPNAPVNSAVKSLQLSVLPACHLPKVGYSSNKFMYRFLAESQRTAIAVTAVHTPEVIALFNRMIIDRRFQLFNSENATIPSFEAFANLWSEFCNEGNNIFYKLPEHLKTHFNILEDRKKYGESVSLNIVASREVRQIAQSESRYTGSIPAIRQPHRPPQVAIQNPSRNHSPSFLSSTPNVPPPTPQIRPMLTSAPHGILLSPLNKAIKRKQKEERTCQICGEKGCGGAWRKKKCQNKCGICRKDDCLGRSNGPPCDNTSNS